MIQDLFRKFSDLFFDATVGLVEEYKRTTLDLAKIGLASAYLRIIRLIRRECLFMTLLIFGAMVCVNAAGIVQVAILLYAPWGIVYRVLGAIAIGVVGAAIPLAVILRYFSQKRWMRFTKADELLASATENLQNGT